MQEQSCVIDGECYGPGEESADDRCLVCRPETSRTQFSTNEGLNEFRCITGGKF